MERCTRNFRMATIRQDPKMTPPYLPRDVVLNEVKDPRLSLNVSKRPYFKIAHNTRMRFT